MAGTYQARVEVNKGKPPTVRADSNRIESTSAAVVTAAAPQPGSREINLQYLRFVVSPSSW